MEGLIDSERLKKARRLNFGSFMVGNLISGFGETCFQIAYIPFVYVVTNYNLFLTGVLTTFTIMWAFIPAPFSGKLSDRFGRKKMLILSTPISGLGVFLLYFVDQTNLYLLLISIVLRSLGFMSSNMNSRILVSESAEGSKKNLGKVFGTLAFVYFCSTIGGAFFVNRTGYDHRIYFMIFLIIRYQNI